MVSLIRRILVLISIENNNNGWFVRYISINEYEGTYKYGMSQKKNVYNRTLWTWTFCPINIHIRIKEFHDIFKYYKFENNFANIVINELNFLFILYHINIDTI